MSFQAPENRIRLISHESTPSAPNQDEQRPLFTIAVLVSGVVGGLVVVIAIVWLYRLCLKKRPPVTTTGKPEQKREQVRSDATSHSRPLPLPLDIVPQEQTMELNPETGSFGSPTRLSQVFPLMSKEPSYVQRSVQDVTRTTTTKSSLLSVADPPSRARSADLLNVNDPSDTRRASCDVPRGTGRQLPSTEGLEKQYAERQRRMSTLARSDAIQGLQNMPRKQNSSPLPEFPRIYERGHAHSRSWNPGYDEGHPLEPLQYQYDRIPPREPMYSEQPPTIFIPTINEPHPEHHSERQHLFHKQAKSFDVSSNERRLSYDRRTSSLASRALPPPETSISAACHSLWAAKGHLEQLHALGISDPSSASTSFDSNTDSQSTTIDSVTRVEDADKKRSQYRCEVRDAHRKRMSFRASKYSNPYEGYTAAYRREYRDFDNRRFPVDRERQLPNIGYNSVPSLFVASYWQRRQNGQTRGEGGTRKHGMYDGYPVIRGKYDERARSLETRRGKNQNYCHQQINKQHKCQNQKLDYPSSNAWKMESSRRGSDGKRKDYFWARFESFTQRNTTHVFIKFTIFFETNQNGLGLYLSSGKCSRQLLYPAWTPIQWSHPARNLSLSAVGTPPAVILVSNMQKIRQPFLEQRRLSLLNRQVTSVPQMARTERDYSVDEKSDNLFREWSRVDPAYDDRRSNPPLQRGITHDVPSYNSRVHVYQRQHSVAGAPLQTPIICYPGQNYFR